MIETFFSDVKAVIDDFLPAVLQEDSKKHTFLVLGEEKNEPPKRRPHTIVIMGDSETLERGNPGRDSNGDIVTPFAIGTLELDVICYGSTYTSARLMMYALIIATESIKLPDGSRKYPLDVDRISFRYGTYEVEHGFRAARASLPIQNQGVVDESFSWADLNSVITNFKLNDVQHLTTEVS